MNTLQKIIVASLLLLVSAEAASACSCSMPTIAEARGRARAVFIGEVVSRMSDRIVFRVVERWKGVEARKVKVRIGRGCPVRYDVGDRYLVYAFSGRRNVPLAMSYCYRTQPLEFATEDLKALGPGELMNKAR
jgi:hypothetical protein